MSRLKAQQVFTPGAFPSHTYVERSNKRYENRLRDALLVPGQVISLSGPSKSGKTVLVEHVVGTENLITVTGAGIDSPDDLWGRILDWMASPSEYTRTNTVQGAVTTGGEAKGGMEVPFFAKGEVAGKAEVQITGATAGGKTYHRRGLTQVVEEIGGSDFVVLIDDFHYMKREVQAEVAMQVKEAARLGVKVITASVSHRSDDVVRALPELRGRVLTVDVDPWDTASLRAISESGFDVLNADANKVTHDDFASEAAGSPQLMQAICLNACFELGIRERTASRTAIAPSKVNRREILERTAAATNFRSLVDVLDSGPKTRGTERKTYRFADGTEGDVYRCILKAVATDPPQLSFTYEQILHRVRAICVDEEPVGSSITGSCLHMSKLAEENFPKERVVDWDEQKLVFDIPDPFLLFYLRWSGRLMEPER